MQYRINQTTKPDYQKPDYHIGTLSELTKDGYNTPKTTPLSCAGNTISDFIRMYQRTENK